jgi:hypothetical protein
LSKCAKRCSIKLHLFCIKANGVIQNINVFEKLNQSNPNKERFCKNARGKEFHTEHNTPIYPILSGGPCCKQQSHQLCCKNNAIILVDARSKFEIVAGFSPMNLQYNALNPNNTLHIELIGNKAGNHLPGKSSCKKLCPMDQR